MSSPSRRAIRWASLIAVIVLPLAVTGLFVGAASQGTNALANIPVAIVNQDTLQTTTAPDGTKQNVFAGRQLVTDLTAPNSSAGFDWRITNEDVAAADLKSGAVYAILTVPSNFSTSILSLSGDKPVRANISIRTDDAHSYLTGSVAQVVGQTMTGTFGTFITAQYIGGIYSGIGVLGASLTSAADGAAKISNGASSLSSGLGQYTGGVDSLAAGLNRLDAGASDLSQLSAGVSSYASSVSQLSATLASINPGIQAGLSDPVLSGTLQAVVDGLAQASAGGQTLASQTDTGLAGVQYGVSQSADGANQLSGSSSGLVSGASSVAAGSASLADGLRTGAAQVPTRTKAQAEASAAIASDPVGLTVSTDNAVSNVGQIVATFVVPLGLWIGALEVFLLLRPVSRRVLASSARDGRLVASALVRAGAITVAQALLLVLLLHVTLSVSWSLLPATLLFSLVMGLAFTAFHYLLTVWLGRGGLIISLFLLIVQVTATGGIYPIQLLATPFQAISPVLPLTWAVGGMHAIIAGGNAGSAVAAVLALLGFGVISALLALVAVRRARRAISLGLVPATTSPVA